MITNVKADRMTLKHTDRTRNKGGNHARKRGETEKRIKPTNRKIKQTDRNT